MAVSMTKTESFLGFNYSVTETIDGVSTYRFNAETFSGPGAKRKCQEAILERSNINLEGEEVDYDDLNEGDFVLLTIPVKVEDIGWYGNNKFQFLDEDNDCAGSTFELPGDTTEHEDFKVVRNVKNKYHVGELWVDEDDDEPVFIIMDDSPIGWKATSYEGADRTHLLLTHPENWNKEFTPSVNL